MKITSRTTKRGKVRALRASTPRARGVARQAEAGKVGINFHTHIGRPVLDANGEPAWERVPSIHGKGRWRIEYEYVPRFSDPGETARVMVMAAARKAKLDARRSRLTPSVRSTGEPLTEAQRADNYRAQRGTTRLTPRQYRRIDHKARGRVADRAE